MERQVFPVVGKIHLVSSMMWKPSKTMSPRASDAGAGCLLAGASPVQRFRQLLNHTLDETFHFFPSPVLRQKLTTMKEKVTLGIFKFSDMFCLDVLYVC